MSTQTDVTRTSPIVPPGTWIVDPAHSTVEFAVKHMGIATVRGRGDKLTISLDLSAIEQS
jgi:polyisoprenoid-binding protein YceI